VSWKEYVKPLIPQPLLERLTEYRFRRINRQVDAAYSGENANEVFSNIYENGIWGRKPGTDFFSGGGSHDPELVEPYVKAVVVFLSSLSPKPSVVDLGCGDFNVGNQIRDYCGRYTACDVVPALINHNQKRFSDRDVDFRCLDAASDDLPEGDIVVLRQVLQHLSNDNISKVIRKLAKYRFLVLSESLPLQANFAPNLEKQTGPGMRVTNRSGVVVTEPPFSLSFIAEQHICSITNQATRIQTTVYQLR
jgi:SAM-dependent methyltransferase